MQAKEDVWLWEKPERSAMGDAQAVNLDPFGDPIPGAPEPAAEPADPEAPPGVPSGARRLRALVWPRSAADNSSREVATVNQNTVTVGLSALLPSGTAVSPTEQAYARGEVYEVEGYAADYKRRGVLVALRRVAG